MPITLTRKQSRAYVARLMAIMLKEDDKVHNLELNNEIKKNGHKKKKYVINFLEVEAEVIKRRNKGGERING